MGLRAILVCISLFLHTKKNHLRTRAAVVTAETPTQQMRAVPSWNRVLVMLELLAPEPWSRDALAALFPEGERRGCSTKPRLTPGWWWWRLEPATAVGTPGGDKCPLKCHSLSCGARGLWAPRAQPRASPQLCVFIVLSQG